MDLNVDVRPASGTPERRRRGFLRGLAVMALATAMWASTAGTASAARSPEPAGTAPQAGPPRDCIEADGTNLNEVLGVKERIIGPPECRVALKGEKWRRLAPTWLTAPSGYGAVYPEGYTPAKFNPIDDFNSKFRGMRVVVDRGTPQERTFVFGREALRTGFVTADGFPFSAPLSGTLPPFSVGQHTSVVFLRLSAAHCDGLGTDVEFNCLLDGEFQYTPDTIFEVLPKKRGR